MITLYHGGRSGFSASVLIMLAEKDIAFESRPIDLAAFEQHDEAFLAINPAGQLPVLELDGQRLTETVFILLYLDERHPQPPLNGRDATSRYQVQKWGKYLETHFAPNLSIVGWAQGGTLPDPKVREGFARLTPERRALWERASVGFPESEIDEAATAVAKAIERLAEDLDAHSWLAGPDYTLADIALFPHVLRARDLGFALPASVSDWMERISMRPRVLEVIGLRGHARELATMGPERGRWG